jgi:hypothetical protein
LISFFPFTTAAQEVRAGSANQPPAQNSAPPMTPTAAPVPNPGSQAAVLTSQGSVTVNARPSLDTNAVFPGDSVQTQPDSTATLTFEGSSVTVQGDSAARYEGTGMIVERGGITVTTQRGLAVQVGCMMITPAADGWAEFTVTNHLGLVEIAVTKGTMSVAEGGRTDKLSAGQHAQREDCIREAKARKRGAVPGATGGILDSTWVQIGGIGLVGGTMVWILTRDEEPLSPAKP